FFSSRRRHTRFDCDWSSDVCSSDLVSKACGLAKLVLSKPGVERIAVMMSIVSNTRVDIVARGVIKACLELGHDPAEKIAIFRIRSEERRVGKECRDW